jgi:hypothetical protein
LQGFFVKNGNTAETGNPEAFLKSKRIRSNPYLQTGIEPLGFYSLLSWTGLGAYYR